MTTSTDTRRVTVRWVEHHVYQAEFEVPAELGSATALVEEYLDYEEAWPGSDALREVTMREVVSVR